MLALLGLLFTASISPMTLTVDLTTVDPIEEQKVTWMTALANCESGGTPLIYKKIDTNGYYSYSRYQYQLKTWLKYGKQFGATRENIYDANLQDKVTRYVLDTYGYENDWVTCGARVKKLLGQYPS